MKKGGKSDSLVSSTFSLLEKAIGNGALNPGRVIVVSTVAELIGSGRSPVKTAIAAPHAEGLLVNYNEWAWPDCTPGGIPS